MRAFLRTVLIIALVATTACAGRELFFEHKDLFLERTVVVDGIPYRYRVVLPRHYTRLRSWPVLLFLHGSGERGDDNISQTTVGIGPALVAERDLYSCIVVLPQCRSGREWFGPMEKQALAALDRSIREFRGDPRRIYLTGISMGGTGAWYFARNKGRFAATVPICGEVVAPPGDPFDSPPTPDIAQLLSQPDPYAALAARLEGTPIWVFHGASDDQVDVGESRSMVRALKALGIPVNYTEYPNTGHDSWDRAYEDPGLIHWILSQRLPAGRP
jgi:predicted peptidase